MNTFKQLFALGFLATSISALAGDQIMKLNKENAQQVISACSNNFHLIIKFSATWCEPCKQIAPIFEEASTTIWKDKYMCVEVDYDELPELAKEYEVTMLPTFVVIHHNKMVGKISGMMNKEQLIERVEEIIHPKDLSQLSKEKLNEGLLTEITSGSVASIKKLIDAGADVNASFKDGSSPLIMAISIGQIRPDGVEKIKLLLESGATVTITLPGQPEQKMSDFVKMLIQNSETLIERQKSMLALLEKEEEKRAKKEAPQTKEVTRSCSDGACSV